MSRRTLRNLLLPALATGFCFAVDANAAEPIRFEADGRVYGLPEAQVFTETYAGPPAVGDTLTLAPEIAALAPGNRTHEVRVDIVAREIEIAPDVRYRAWTFGGSVPGPVLHVREGDRVIFTMMNRSAERMEVTAPDQAASPYLARLAALNPQKAESAPAPSRHSMDFHSGTVAANDKWRGIEPGETIRFEWLANYPGVFLYHCGTAPILMHMAMGQYGVVVVSPRQGYPTDAEVDREYVIVQSEFYLKEIERSAEEGEPAENVEPTPPLYTLDFDAARNKQPSHVVFNGHQRALLDAPLVARPGERVRLYVLNVGPTDTSSFHVVGAIFDRVFYEGNPANDWRGMQTVLLGASNGAVVEFVVPEEGDYILVDHEFADAQKGAVGRMTTGRMGGPAGAAGH
jgi:nitrite reductase (NO-forming)